MRMKNIDDIANVDEIVKVVEDNNENGFFFVPWIGANYSKGLEEKKVLVVGASHYCNHSSICNGLTAIMVVRIIVKITDVN